MTAGVVVWVTGLPSAGKSTFARNAHEALRADRCAVCLFDGDAVRRAVFPELGYTPAERAKFYEALANLAALVARQGLVVLVAATAHRREFRARGRELAPAFVEVWVSTPQEECVARDASRLYAGQRGGAVHGLPGGDEVYEPPEAPEIVARGGFDVAALEALFALVRRPSPS
jgi:adenylylsulfate kinase